jgi:hypothetical protein
VLVLFVGICAGRYSRRPGYVGMFFGFNRLPTRLSKRQRRAANDGKIKYSQDKACFCGSYDLIHTLDAGPKTLASANKDVPRRRSSCSRTATTGDEWKVIFRLIHIMRSPASQN